MGTGDDELLDPLLMRLVVLLLFASESTSTKAANAYTRVCCLGHLKIAVGSNFYGIGNKEKSAFRIAINDDVLSLYFPGYTPLRVHLLPKPSFTQDRITIEYKNAASYTLPDNKITLENDRFSNIFPSRSQLNIASTGFVFLPVLVTSKLVSNGQCFR